MICRSCMDADLADELSESFPDISFQNQDQSSRDGDQENNIFNVHPQDLERRGIYKLVEEGEEESKGGGGKKLKTKKVSYKKRSQIEYRLKKRGERRDEYLKSLADKGSLFLCKSFL